MEIALIFLIPLLLQPRMLLECEIIGSVAKLIVTVCYLQLVVFFSLNRFNIWYRL